MSVGQDQVSAIISSISNALDPQSFYNAFETQKAISKVKMSSGATSIIAQEEPNELWTNEGPWNVTIDISSLDQMVDNLGSEICAVATRPTGVTPERLSNFRSINIESAEKTIVSTFRHINHERSSHVNCWYSTYNRILHYECIKTHFFMNTFQVTIKSITQQKNSCVFLIQVFCFCIQWN